MSCHKEGKGEPVAVALLVVTNSYSQSKVSREKSYLSSIEPQMSVRKVRLWLRTKRCYLIEYEFIDFKDNKIGKFDSVVLKAIFNNDYDTL